jgi:hypothetical protein
MRTRKRIPKRRSGGARSQAGWWTWNRIASDAAAAQVFQSFCGGPAKERISSASAMNGNRQSGTHTLRERSTAHGIVARSTVVESAVRAPRSGRTNAWKSASPATLIVTTKEASRTGSFVTRSTSAKRSRRNGGMKRPVE